MLVVALSPKNPYSYYIILRIVVFSCCAYLLYGAIKLRKMSLSWVLMVAALLYNPFIRVHLARSTWSIINVVTAGLFMAVSVYFVVGPGGAWGRTEGGENDR
jgi:hypothetical protein